MTAVERELKLTPPAGFAIDVMPPPKDVTPSPPALLRLQTVYYDTPDLRLLRWGCNLRYRAGAGWTLKLPAPSGGMGLARQELQFEGAESAPPPRALELVGAFARGRALAPIAELRTVRHSITYSAGGHAVAEIDDDDVIVVAGGAAGERFRQLEVELLDNAPANVMAAFAKHLRKLGVSCEDPSPKVLHALGLAAPPAPEIDARVASPRSSAIAALRAVLAANVERMIRLDPAIRLEAHPEAVHQARTSARRLRSALQTYRPILEKAWADRIIGELRRLGRELGAVRDADILADRLSGHVAALPKPVAAEAQPILRAYREEQTHARERLRDVMCEPRYFSVIEDLVDAAGHPQLAVGPAVSALDCMPRLMRRTFKKLREQVESIDGTPTDRQLHRIRIRAKRARYAAEAFAPIAGKRAKPFVKRARQLQEMLGEQHDAVVDQHRLLRYHDDPALAFAAGELFALEGRAAGAARLRWRGIWEEAAAKKRRFWD